MSKNVGQTSPAMGYTAGYILTWQSIVPFKNSKLFSIGILEAAFSKAGCKCNVLFGFSGIIRKKIFEEGFRRLLTS